MHGATIKMTIIRFNQNINNYYVAKIILDEEGLKTGIDPDPET